MKYDLDAEAVARLRSAIESWADHLELGVRQTDKLPPSQDKQRDHTNQTPTRRPASKPPTPPPGDGPRNHRNR
jgi:hypothetical protein